MKRNMAALQNEVPMRTMNLTQTKLDEILARLDSRMALVCPLCGARVEYSHAIRLDPGVNTVACSECCGYFIAEVRKIDDSA